MSRHAVEAYRAALNDLFRRRSRWLRRAVEGTPGAPPKLDRDTLDRSVGVLQDYASKALATDLARREFQSSVDDRKRWQVPPRRGWERDAKQQAFKAWFETHCGGGNHVYVFWQRRKCIYVGRTRKSGGGGAGHFDKHCFAGVTRIDIYRASGRRSLPVLECLAIHRFQPTRNKVSADRKEWTRQCPICLVHRRIKDEMYDFF